MLPSECIAGEAVRIELDETTGKLFVVFEVTELYKKYIIENWVEDVEFKIIGKSLILEK